MTRRPTRHGDREPVVSQEESLLGLLRRAERHAYALAHGYDIGGQPDRAYAFVALGERLYNTARDASDLVRPFKPQSGEPVRGLRARAFLLRRILRGTSREYLDVVPIVPRSTGEQPLAEARDFADRDKECPRLVHPAEHSA
jgi:hypothetical protein